jgi:hypothetical protein
MAGAPDAAAEAGTGTSDAGGVVTPDAADISPTCRRSSADLERCAGRV